MRNFRTVLASLGIVLAGSAFASCGGGSTNNAPSATGGAGADGTDGGAECIDGTERCPCYRNGTCDEGLECLSDLCVKPKGTGGSGGESGGTGGTGGTDPSGGAGESSGGDVGSGGTGGSGTGGSGTGGSGTGGSGTGGSGTGGSGTGGSGTGGAEPGVCAVNTVPAGTLIMDWECLVDDGSGQPQIVWTPINDFPHGSYVYANTEPDTTDTWTADEVEFSGGIKPGHSSANALGVDMAKPAGNWGCGTGVWMGGGATENPLERECIDFSQYQGIAMWVKGYIRNTDDTPSDQGWVTVYFSTQETISAEQWSGGCTLGDECRHNRYQLDMTGKQEWTQVHLPWSSFTGGSAPLNPSEAMGIVFEVMGDRLKGQKLQFHVDDIELYPGPSQLPRVCE